MKTAWRAGVALALLSGGLLPVRGMEGTEDILFLDLPQVVTASKTSQELENATSVMTVVTREDIVRSGARTVYDVLKRVPGFFPSAQATWMLVGSRGLMADGNDHILFLVDGHQQNSIVGQGYQQQDNLPVLDKVERIEIIRGPGSVLWGSSAVYGIINLITRDGLDGRRNAAAFAYGGGDGMTNGNYMYSLDAERGLKGIISAGYWKSSGFNRKDRTGTGAAWTKTDAAGVNGNVEFPWGEVGDWPALDQHREGYEMYAKLATDKGRFLARVAQSNVAYPWDGWLGKPGSDLSMRKAYVEHQREGSLFGGRLDLQHILYADLLLQNRFPRDTALFLDNASAGAMQDQSNEELAFGTELTGTVRVAENDDLQLGVKGVRTKVGPNRDARFNSFLNVASSTSLPYIGVESGHDNNLALYFENSLRLFQDRTTFFCGARYDKNDFREDKWVFLPRAGLIQALGGSLTAKYVLNTGYLRPPAVYSKTVGVIADTSRGPTQGITRVGLSERIQSHDFQLFWKRRKDYAAVTGFYMKIKDYLSFDTVLPQGYKTLGDAVTRGVEVEGKKHLGSRWAAYGNYSLAKASLLTPRLSAGSLTDSQDAFMNHPRHIYNLGVDWAVSRTHFLNVNLNGWAYMRYVRPIQTAAYAGQNDTLKGEQSLDIALTGSSLLKGPLDFTLFVHNALDNRDPVGLAVNTGVYSPRGRNLGARLSLRW